MKRRIVSVFAAQKRVSGDPKDGNTAELKYHSFILGRYNEKEYFRRYAYSNHRHELSLPWC